MDTRDWWSDKTVVITGATGYLGSGLTARLADRAARLRLVSRTPPICNGTSIDWCRGDVRDADLWKAVVPGADVLFHLAGQTSHAIAERDSDIDFDVNVRAAELLARACRRCGTAPLVVNAGTVTQAGLLPDDVSTLTEDTADAPATTYDLHKCVA